MSIDNPWAFPVSTIDGDTNCGMTLRDWFAGQVAAEAFRSVAAEWDDPLLRTAKPYGATAESWIPVTVAGVSYQIADAMLGARTPDLGDVG